MKLYWLPPSKDRANLRSVTPPGFAKATFEAKPADAGKRAAAESGGVAAGHQELLEQRMRPDRDPHQGARRGKPHRP